MYPSEMTIWLSELADKTLSRKLGECLMGPTPITSGYAVKFPVVILQHRSLLVINQHRFHTTTEVAEGANQSFVGMLSILFWCGEDMEAAGEPRRINRKVNFAPLPGNLHLSFAPVVLELVSKLSFEANCSF